MTRSLWPAWSTPSPSEATSPTEHTSMKTACTTPATPRLLATQTTSKPPRHRLDTSFPLRHSHSGICFAYANPTTILQTAKFSSTSKKQSLVCLSSTEAEVYAAVEATKDIVFLRAILAELGFPQLLPTTLYVDNLSMITLASKFSGNAKRVKHFLVRINYMIEQVANQVVHLEYISSHEHPADFCTKPLARGPLEKHRAQLLGPQRDDDED